MNKDFDAETDKNAIIGVVKEVVRNFETLAVAHQQGDYYRFFHAYNKLLDLGLQLYWSLKGNRPWKEPPPHVLNWLMGETELRYFVDRMLPVEFKRTNEVQERIMDWLLFLMDELHEKIGDEVLPHTLEEIEIIFETYLKDNALQNFRKVYGTKNIYRSSNPPYQDKQDLIGWYKENNIKYIIDLRKPSEINKIGHNPDISEKLDIKISEISYNLPENLRIDAHPYVQGLIGLRKEIKRIFTLILNASGGILLHCVAGKDRTGIISALIQLLLKIPEEKVIEDYIASGHDTRIDRIQQVLEYVNKEGGIESFLDTCGINREMQEKIIVRIKN